MGTIVEADAVERVATILRDTFLRQSSTLRYDQIERQADKRGLSSEQVAGLRVRSWQQRGDLRQI